MKPYLLLLILVSILVSAFWYGVIKSMESRCAYYKRLGWTQAEREVCQ